MHPAIPVRPVGEDLVLPSRGGSFPTDPTDEVDHLAKIGRSTDELDSGEEDRGGVGRKGGETLDVFLAAGRWSFARR